MAERIYGDGSGGRIRGNQTEETTETAEETSEKKTAGDRVKSVAKGAGAVVGIGALATVGAGAAVGGVTKHHAEKIVDGAEAVAGALVMSGVEPGSLEGKISRALPPQPGRDKKASGEYGLEL